jgi:hypothetical protein
LNIFSFLFSFPFICLVVSSLRHSIVFDLKHRSTLFCSMYVLAVVEIFLNLLTLFQVRYLMILSVSSNEVMFCSHRPFFSRYGWSLYCEMPVFFTRLVAKMILFFLHFDFIFYCVIVTLWGECDFSHTVITFSLE